MINRQTATLLACFMAWADRLTFEAVRRLPEGEGTKPPPAAVRLRPIHLRP